MHASKYPRAAVVVNRSVYRKGGQRDRRAQPETRKPKRKIPYRTWIRDQWLARRKPSKRARDLPPVGDWDLETSLAVRFGWLPKDIGALDPDYVQELLGRLDADAIPKDD